MDYKISNATVITNNGDEVLYGAQVNIAGGKIAYAGSPEGAGNINCDREIDAGGNIVMPGFFNMHTHIPMTLFRCYADDLALQDWLFKKIFPAEDKLTDDMVYWASLASLVEFAAAGIVGFNEMYSNCDAIMKAVRQSGHKAALSRGVVCFDPEGIELRMRETHEAYEKHHREGKIHVFIAPHAQYTVDNATLERLAECAKKYGTGIHTHVSETRSEHEECIEKTGKTPIALFEELGLLDVPFIGAHCVWVSDDDIDIMAKHNVTVASCPRSNLKLASGIAPLKKMLDKGVNVTLGTDSSASNNKLSVMSEMTFASFLQKGVEGDPELLPAGQSIRLATLNGARALGFNSGVIEKGTDADIIMLDTKGIRYSPRYNPVASVVYAASESDVCMTMVDGEIIYENGKCAFADVDEIKERLEEYAKIIKA